MTDIDEGIAEEHGDEKKTEKGGKKEEGGVWEKGGQQWD